MQDQRGSRQPDGLLWYWLVPVALVVALLAVGGVTVATLSGSGDASDDASAADAARKLPPYWTVKSGDSYGHIAQRTGLSIDDIETFNPHTDPGTLVPGQKIKLRLHVPKPPSKPLGPRLWTVKAGDTFDSIGKKTGHRIDEIRRLNRKVNPDTLQPGQRLRLRR